MTEHLTDRQIIALRTQSAEADEAFTLLEHAATCAMCSERIMSRTEMALQMASVDRTLRASVEHLSLDEMNDLVDGTLDLRDKNRTDEHLAKCTACSSLAMELKGLARPTGAIQVPPLRFTEWLRAFFTLPRMVGAAAVILLAVLGGLFLSLHQATQPQVTAQRQPDNMPPTAGNRPRELVPQTNGQGNKNPLPGSASGPEQGARRQGSILAIALMPGIVRGEDSGRSVHLPAQLDALQLTLNSRAVLTPGRYRTSIADSAGRRVWRNEANYRTSEDAIVVRVPAKLLPVGRYTITLSSVERDGTSEDLEEYGLHIVR